jgi:hypothetical protein
MRRTVKPGGFFQVVTDRLVGFFTPNKFSRCIVRSVQIALLASAGLLSAVVASHAQQASPAQRATTAEALQTEIAALKAPKVAWREIAWKNCLLEGLKESRAQNKPALLWVFIDRPIDDARC